MATYEEIYGKRVKEFDSDPTLESSYEGQVWYDKSSGVLKSVVSSGAWSSSTPFPQAIHGNRMAGTQTAGVSAFGKLTPAVTGFAAEYNGSGWSTTGTGNTARAYMAGFGIQTAAYFSGGYNGTALNNSESYNGSTFSNGPTIGTARWYVGGAGTSTAGLIYLGTTPGSTVANTEEWDGSSWSEVTDNPTARRFGNGFGTQTAAVAAGGMPNTTTTSQEYDGTNWTSGGTLNTGRAYMAGWGTQTAGLVAAGNASGSVSNATERYDGTSFSTTGSLATARNDAGGAGATQNSGVLAGGFTSGSSTHVEEYNFGINTITAAAWASAAAMNTGRARFGSAGAKDSALAFGGYTVPGNTTNTEKYDGTSWTETGNTPDARNSNTGTGSQTAAMSMSGQDSTGGPTTATITFDGSSWSSAPALNVRRQSASASSASPYNSVVMMGGYGSAPGGPPHIVGATEEYDGSSWSNQTAMPTGVQQNSGGGTQTAALVAGGYGPDGGSIRDFTQFYNGSSWTTGPATLVSAQQWMGYAGTQTDNFIFGGSSGPASTQTARAQAYDGTAWSTKPSLGTGRYGIRGSVQGTTTSASAFGGLVPSPFTGLTNTEEFTGTTETVAFKTLTTS